MLDWLTSVDYSSQQNDFVRGRQEGTGEWLLKSNEFQHWVNQDSQTLFCPGIPGAGKTIITAIVVEHLSKTFGNDAKVGIGYLYCNFRRQQEQSREGLLLNLLKQLAQAQPSVPESVETLYKHHEKQKTRPSFVEIVRVLNSVVSGYTRAFIVIDALDECQAFGGDRKSFLSEIFNLQANTGANIFATSRFIPAITEEFKGCLSVEIRAMDGDVQKYIAGHISRLPSFVSDRPELQREIEAEIISAADGMYFLPMLPW
jgi:Cdc6-like AAA superfamily ATPase